MASWRTYSLSFAFRLESIFSTRACQMKFNPKPQTNGLIFAKYNHTFMIPLLLLHIYDECPSIASVPKVRQLSVFRDTLRTPLFQ